MHLRAYIYLLLTAVFWGGNAVAGKLAIGNISPMMLTTVRWAMAVLLLCCFALPQVRRDWAAVKRNWLVLSALGASGFTAFNVSLYSALQFTSAINVVIEQAGMPLVIFLANFLIFRIAAHRRQVMGFLITLVGVLIVASGGHIGNLLALNLNRGDAIMLLAVLLYGGYTVALRFKPQMHWQSTMAVMATAAFIASLPFTFWEWSAGNLIVPGVKGLTIALYTAIFPSLMAQVFYIRGNELIGGNRAGLFINLVPIFGTLFSVIILGETLHPYHVIALALVMGGIWMAESVKRQPVADEPPSPS